MKKLILALTAIMMVGCENPPEKTIGGWHNMRSDAETICKQIKKRFWGLESNALYGIHYDDTADILWDIHQCLRHQLWLDKPEGEKSHITVDSDTPMRVGSEPLINITRNE